MLTSVFIFKFCLVTFPRVRVIKEEQERLFFLVRKVGIYRTWPRSQRHLQFGAGTGIPKQKVKRPIEGADRCNDIWHESNLDSNCDKTVLHIKNYYEKK